MKDVKNDIKEWIRSYINRDRCISGNSFIFI